jgi:hypothetical protein
LFVILLQAHPFLLPDEFKRLSHSAAQSRKHYKKLKPAEQKLGGHQLAEVDSSYESDAGTSDDGGTDTAERHAVTVNKNCFSDDSACKQEVTASASSTDSELSQSTLICPCGAASRPKFMGRGQLLQQLLLFCSSNSRAGHATTH